MQPGIFAAGTATGPMDIVDSIMTAGAAASEASTYLKMQRNGNNGKRPAPELEEMEAQHV
jgi:heterodisulfide reductase subunit A-like polyferredoxin